jgi:predicted O-linked N-acetylglucosamine transferase (SPINDLY family)
MSEKYVVMIQANDHAQAYQYLLNKNYTQATDLYEQIIAVEPENKALYWYLGLALLLQGQEVEAQTTWLFAMANGEAQEVQHLTEELVTILETEAYRQTEMEDYTIAWAIRQHLREIAPDDINNLLQLVDLSITLNLYQESELTQLGIIEKLQTDSSLNINQDLLLHIVQKILDYAPLQSASEKLIVACVQHIDQVENFIDILIPVVYEIAYSSNEIPLAAHYVDLGLQLAPENNELLRAAAGFYVDLTEYSKAIDYAKLCYSWSNKLSEKVFDNHIILRAMMSAGGYSKEAPKILKKQEELITDLVEQHSIEVLELGSILRLYCTSFYFPYVQDLPHKNMKLRQQVAQISQENLEKIFSNETHKYRDRALKIKEIKDANKPLKIGYLSHCLRRHSVGWIARWLFQYHNHERFEIYGYLLGSDQRTDPLMDWFCSKTTKAYKYGLGGKEVAEQIYQDKIDILIDLDSITLSNTCGIMALKPAPIQVTWLGWDASGIPTIDYYIADPYVLPENAQDYYSEKIWRLPQTYLAIDGFDVSVPTLRRDQLEIPNDAVIYFSTQRGSKYNPQTLKLQMRIIKEVPNSYFIIKGFGDTETLNQFLIKIAEEEDVSRDRLRFLPRVAFEELHRANMGIADIVLDTYPYNGATTTLETLWIGIPMITKVGEQFAARNSYTMMINAGITEGIAWTDEEYVEWGIKLGKDENLRQQIAWKLRKNRQTAPLWNAKQFTREMENAYQQMWQKYIEGKN